MTLVRLLLAFDALAALGIVAFFIIGIQDGSISSFNGGLWFGLIAALAVILGGGWKLAQSGNRRAAITLLLVLAIPALCFLLFFGLILIVNPRWN